jgi:hypothetical protein
MNLPLHPLPGGEPATGASNEAPLLGGAGGGFMAAMHVEENMGSIRAQNLEMFIFNEKSELDSAPLPRIFRKLAARHGFEP